MKITAYQNSEIAWFRYHARDVELEADIAYRIQACR